MKEVAYIVEVNCSSCKDTAQGDKSTLTKNGWIFDRGGIYQGKEFCSQDCKDKYTEEWLEKRRKERDARYAVFVKDILLCFPTTEEMRYYVPTNPDKVSELVDKIASLVDRLREAEDY